MNYLYLKLNEEKSLPLVEIVKAANQTKKEASKIVKQYCDEVFTSEGWLFHFHMGFKEKQTDNKWLKKFEQNGDYFIHTPKVKSEEHKAIQKAESMVKESKSFERCIKEAYPEFNFDVTGTHIRGKGFPIYSPTFGFTGKLAVCKMPYKEGVVISEDWEEITFSEFSKLVEA